MTDLRISVIGEHDPNAVADLWGECGLIVPHNPPLHDIAFAAAGATSEILLGMIGDRLVASVMVGHDGHRGWLYYLAVHPDWQGSGHGATMVDAAESWLRARGVRKVQLMVRETNVKVLGFYERIGYERSAVAVLARWLVEDPRE